MQLKNVRCWHLGLCIAFSLVFLAVSMFVVDSSWGDPHIGGPPVKQAEPHLDHIFPWPPPVLRDAGPSYTGMANIGNLTEVVFIAPSYNHATHEYVVQVAVKNVSSQLVKTPLVTGFDDLEGATLSTLDGTMSNGSPYIDFTLLVGDGELDPDEQSPSYRVAFVVDDLGQFSFDTSVWGVPRASVTACAAPANGPTPVEASFCCTKLGGNIALIEWDFDSNGTWDWTGTPPECPTHSYDGFGTFTATVRVTAGTGEKATDEVVISTTECPLALPSAAPVTGEVPLTVSFTPRSESCGLPVVYYYWDWDYDGSFNNSVTLRRPEPRAHTYYSAGTYVAALKVVDTAGATDIKTVTIEVLPVSPTATASVEPSNGAAPLLVTFSGSGSSPNGGISLYEWDFDGNGGFDWSSPSTGNTTHTYPTEGSWQPVFRVTDGIGLQATVDDVVNEVRAGPSQSPTAVASASVTQGDAPLDVTFGCAGSFDPNGSIVLYEWDFDYDGAFEADYTSATTCDTAHTFTRAGQNVVAFRVTDNDALSAIDLLGIDISVDVSVSIPDDTFNPHLDELSSVQTTLSADADVHIYICNRTGDQIRTLFQGFRAAGTYLDYWDGYAAGVGVLPDGDYYASIDYTVDGVVYTKPDSPTGGEEISPPFSEVPTSGGTFSPWEDEFWELTFSTDSPPNDGAAEISLYISEYGADHVLSLLLNRDVVGRGTHQMFWAGVSAAGEFLEDGEEYIWSPWAWTLPDNAVVVEGGKAQIADLAVTANVFNPATPACAGEPETNVEFMLSRNAVVTLDVVSMENGLTLRQITTGLLSAGAQSIHWDGRADSGDFVAPGRYRVDITAATPDGNTSWMRQVIIGVFY